MEVRNSICPNGIKALCKDEPIYGEAKKSHVGTNGVPSEISLGSHNYNKMKNCKRSRCGRHSFRDIWAQETQRLPKRRSPS